MAWEEKLGTPQSAGGEFVRYGLIFGGGRGGRAAVRAKTRVTEIKARAHTVKHGTGRARSKARFHGRSNRKQISFPRDRAIYSPLTRALILYAERRRSDYSITRFDRKEPP